MKEMITKEYVNGKEVIEKQIVYTIEVDYYKYGIGDVKETIENVFDFYNLEYSSGSKQLAIKYMENGKMRLFTVELSEQLNSFKIIRMSE